VFHRQSCEKWCGPIINFFISTISTRPTMRHVRSFHSTISRVIFQTTSFSHPKLTDQEMNDGCRLGIDSFANTCVAGKHAHVIDFIKGKEISAKAWDGHQTHNLCHPFAFQQG